MDPPVTYETDGNYPFLALCRMHTNVHPHLMINSKTGTSYSQFHREDKEKRP